MAKAAGLALAAALTLMMAPVTASAGQHGILIITGNIVIVDEVYLQILNVPEDAKADDEMARDIEVILLDFLRRSGYVLATVQAEVFGDQIAVNIDEGRLAKIALIGKSPAALLAYRARISLPGDVFNRPLLERILTSFYPSNEGKFDYELVPANEKPHLGPQVDISKILAGQAALPSGDRYELHIDMSQDPEAGGGARATFAIDPNGYRGGVGYTLPSLVGRRDRWDVDVAFGLKRFDDLRQNDTHLQPNRIIGGVRYYTPPIIGETVRPVFEIRDDFLRRQRQDIGLQTYTFNRLDGVISASAEPENAELKLGIGVQFRDFRNVDNVPLSEITPEQLGEPSRVTTVAPFTNVLPFVSFEAHLTFSKLVTRFDKAHRLNGDVRYFAGNDGGFVAAFADYQKVFEFGWNDLWITSSGGILQGNFSVADAIPMSGSYVRGVYSDDFYMDRIIALGLEYRFSLTRDLFKVSIFDEAALFREHVIAGVGPQPEVVNAFGPGLHALVMDTIQLDFYASFAVSTVRDKTTGATLRLRRAF